MGNLADIIWIPGGAVAVRVIPRSNLATVVDGSGRVLLVDLSHIDERWNAQGSPITPTDLFETVASALLGHGDYGIGASDPRILWTSEPGLAAGNLAPVVDPDTGVLFAGKLLGKTTSVFAVNNPRVQMKADVGNGSLAEIGGTVPLGVDPPVGVLECNAGTAGCNASMAAFRFELTLPGGMPPALTGSTLRLAVENERVPGAPVDETPAGFPRAHLRLTDAAGNADPRPAAGFVLTRDIPPGMESALRHQKGFNKFVSPWVVTIADPRASIAYLWPQSATAAVKRNAGCASCDRPARLQGLTESAGVYELWAAGRDIAVRAEVCGGVIAGCSGISTIFTGTSYDYLAHNDRLTLRFPSVIADTVRAPAVHVAGHNPPVAGGAFENTIYLHSGELEASSVDLDSGGRAGWDVSADRTYRSRTIGASPLGEGWDSSLFRRLRALPSGDVEYRDGRGEVWLFGKPTGSEQRYTAPQGLFLRLIRSDNGWTLWDQQSHYARFDAFGRLTAEADEFARINIDPMGQTRGNVIRYLYDPAGRLAGAVDPVGRMTTVSYWSSGDTASGAFAGRVREVRSRERGQVLGRRVEATKPCPIYPARAEERRRGACARCS